MIGLEVNGEKKMADLLYELGANANKAISIALLRCAQHAEGEIKRTVGKTFEPGTGDLRRSFKAQMIQETGDELSAGAFSDLIYARVQNEGSGFLPGGVIKSNRGPGKNLAIPVEGEFSKPAPWPSSFGKDAFEFLPSKKPGVTGVLVERLSKGNLGKVKYILKPEVKIKPTYYIEEAQEKSSKEWPRIFNERLAELADASAKKADK